MHLPGGDSVAVLNGEAGWLSTPGRGTREMGPSELFGRGVNAQLSLPEGGLKQFFKILRVQRKEPVHGREAYLLVGLRDNQPPVRLYFDVRESRIAGTHDAFCGYASRSQSGRNRLRRLSSGKWLQNTVPLEGCSSWSEASPFRSNTCSRMFPSRTTNSTSQQARSRHLESRRVGATGLKARNTRETRFHQ